MSYFTQAWAVARKDLAIELRTKESLNAAGAFAIVILLLYSFAFANLDEMKELGGGLLWLVFAFAGALVFNRGFARELPNECLDTLLASPLSAPALVLGKAVANFVMLLVVELVSVIIYPLMVPLLIGAIELTNSLLNHQPITSPDQLLWVRILLVFDIVFTTLAYALADTILLN